MRLFEHTFISGNTCICRNYEWPEFCRERSLQGVSSVVSFYKLELDQWVEVTCRSWVYYQVLCKNLPQNFMNWINSTLSYLIIRQSGLAQWNWLPAPFCVLSLECQMRLPSPMWCLSHLEPLEDSQPSLLFPYHLCVASLGSLAIRHLAAKRRNTVKVERIFKIVLTWFSDSGSIPSSR